jgi:dihydrofolate reductase
MRKAKTYASWAVANSRITVRGRTIDEIGFNIHPVLLGSEIPLFHEMAHQINLELLECKHFKNGCVFVRYRVKA